MDLILVLLSALATAFGLSMMLKGGTGNKSLGFGVNQFLGPGKEKGHNAEVLNKERPQDPMTKNNNSYMDNNGLANNMSQSLNMSGGIPVGGPGGIFVGIGANLIGLLGQNGRVSNTLTGLNTIAGGVSENGERINNKTKKINGAEMLANDMVFKSKNSTIKNAQIGESNATNRKSTIKNSQSSTSTIEGNNIKSINQNLGSSNRIQGSNIKKIKITSPTKIAVQNLKAPKGTASQMLARGGVEGSRNVQFKGDYTARGKISTKSSSTLINNNNVNKVNNENNINNINNVNNEINETEFKNAAENGNLEEYLIASADGKVEENVKSARMVSVGNDIVETRREAVTEALQNPETYKKLQGYIAVNWRNLSQNKKTTNESISNTSNTSDTSKGKMIANNDNFIPESNIYSNNQRPLTDKEIKKGSEYNEKEKAEYKQKAIENIEREREEAEIAKDEEKIKKDLEKDLIKSLMNGENKELAKILGIDKIQEDKMNKKLNSLMRNYEDNIKKMYQSMNEKDNNQLTNEMEEAIDDLGVINNIRTYYSHDNVDIESITGDSA